MNVDMLMDLEISTSITSDAQATGFHPAVYGGDLLKRINMPNYWNSNP